MTDLHPRRAFTLVELLVVIGVISVLAALLLPMIGWIRERARVTVTAQRGQNIITALQTYGDEEQGAAALMSRLPLGGVGRWGTLDQIYAVIERGGGTAAGREWPPYIIYWSNSQWNNVDKTAYNKPANTQQYDMGYRAHKALFAALREPLPPETGPVPQTHSPPSGWYTTAWPTTWPKTNWDTVPVMAAAAGHVPPILRYPWGRPGLRQDGSLVDTSTGAVLIGELQGNDMGSSPPPGGIVTPSFTFTRTTELNNSVNWESWNTKWYDSTPLTNTWAAFGTGIINTYMYTGSDRRNRILGNSYLPSYNRSRVGFMASSTFDAVELAANAYLSRSNGDPVTVDLSRPLPFDAGLMSPMHSLALLQAAGVVTDDGTGWRSDRSAKAAWNDAWGNPLVVNYALYQPERYRNSSEVRNHNMRSWLLDRSLERYGYSRAVYVTVGAVGPEVRSEDAGFGASHPWPDQSQPWSAAADRAVTRWLWRQVREVAQAHRWTEEYLNERPWDGFNLGKYEDQRCVLLAPVEIR